MIIKHQYDRKAPLFEEPEGPSKTQLKQASQDIKDIGVELLALSATQLKAIPMDDRLRAALREHGRMPTREAKRRHMQFIGKLLRDTDSEPARLALIAIRTGEARVLAEAEQWRQRLLDDDAAMTAWIQSHPQAEIQPLRALVRSARRELAAQDAAAEAQAAPAANKGKSRAYRELFQVLRLQLQKAANVAHRTQPISNRDADAPPLDAETD